MKKNRETPAPVSMATLSYVTGEAGTRLIKDIKSTSINMEAFKSCESLIRKSKENNTSAPSNLAFVIAEDKAEEFKNLKRSEKLDGILAKAKEVKTKEERELIRRNFPFAIKSGKMKEFIEESNRNKITDEFLSECRDASKLFKRKKSNDDLTDEDNEWEAIAKIFQKKIKEKGLTKEQVNKMIDRIIEEVRENTDKI